MEAINPTSPSSHILPTYSHPSFPAFYDEMIKILPIEEYEVGVDVKFIYELLRSAILRGGRRIRVLDLFAGTGRISAGLIEKLHEDPFFFHHSPPLHHFSPTFSKEGDACTSSLENPAFSTSPSQFLPPHSTVQSPPQPEEEARVISFHCIDSSPYMLEKCMKRVEEALASGLKGGLSPLLNTKFELKMELGDVGELEQLEIEGNSYDIVVVSAGSFHHLITRDRQIACLRGIKEALKRDPHSVCVVSMLPLSEIQDFLSSKKDRQINPSCEHHEYLQNESKHTKDKHLLLTPLPNGVESFVTDVYTLETLSTESCRNLNEITSSCLPSSSSSSPASSSSFSSYPSSSSSSSCSYVLSSEILSWDISLLKIFSLINIIKGVGLCVLATYKNFADALSHEYSQSFPSESLQEEGSSLSSFFEQKEQHEVGENGDSIESKRLLLLGIPASLWDEPGKGV